MGTINIDTVIAESLRPTSQLSQKKLGISYALLAGWGGWVFIQLCGDLLGG